MSKIIVESFLCESRWYILRLFNRILQSVLLQKHIATLEMINASAVKHVLVKISPAKENILNQTGFQ